MGEGLSFFPCSSSGVGWAGMKRWGRGRLLSAYIWSHLACSLSVALPVLAPFSFPAWSVILPFCRSAEFRQSSVVQGKFRRFPGSAGCGSAGCVCFRSEGARQGQVDPAGVLVMAGASLGVVRAAPVVGVGVVGFSFGFFSGPKRPTSAKRAESLQERGGWMKGALTKMALCFAKILSSLLSYFQKKILFRGCRSIRVIEDQ